MKVKKKKIILIIAIVLSIVTLIGFVVYNYVLDIPDFLCEYIEYNGEKYYPIAIYVSIDVDNVGGIDSNARVPIVLYNSKGKRIGLFRKHYAYRRCNDEDVEFLHFKSRDFTKNPDLWD